MKNLFVPTRSNGYKPILLGNKALAIYTLFLLAFNLFANFFLTDSAYASTITSTNIINLTNAERLRYGLVQLRSNSSLSSAALAKANNMMELQYWNHYGPNGESPWDFIKATGYSYIYAGENLAKGFKSAEGVHEAWMASPTHRENILSGNYNEIGVAVISGRLLGEDVVLVVQMFGNQTTKITPTPKPETEVQQTEPGQVSSIKITSPKENEVLTDPTFDIKGTVDKAGSGYSVDMSEKSIRIGGFQTNGVNWVWDKGSDWAEGDHDVKATVKNVSGVSDSVKFKVDSTGPEIASVSVSKSGSDWALFGEIVGGDKEVNIVSGDTNLQFALNAQGEFSGTIPSSSIANSVTIMCSDPYGNITQKDITNLFSEEKEGKVLSVVMAFMNSLDTQEIVNGIFLGFIFLLLLVEVITFARKKMLAKHADNLLAIAFWWVILCVGLIAGFNGSIV